MAHKLYKRSMTFKILTLACLIASEDGIFTLNALRIAVKKEYPTYDRIFVTNMVQKMWHFRCHGYIKMVGREEYRILPDTLEQCLDELTSTPSKIPQYFASI